MRISDWSSDVCSSDLDRCVPRHYRRNDAQRFAVQFHPTRVVVDDQFGFQPQLGIMIKIADGEVQYLELRQCHWPTRSEEHTSELQSLMRISYAVFCLQKKNKNKGPPVIPDCT